VDTGSKAAKKGKPDKDAAAGGKGKAAKTSSDGPSSSLPPTLSPVYSSAVVPPAPRKSETKRAISNIISSLSPKRFAVLYHCDQCDWLQYIYTCLLKADL